MVPGFLGWNPKLFRRASPVRSGFTGHRYGYDTALNARANAPKTPLAEPVSRADNAHYVK
ncbi:hypothetical protein GCM10011591_05260 [Nocardia camponoti]|uniref:Uncharacterized protein n=1 Tax=Nocardia camponoti TaxID=1616106 RepID=A0A917V409_9NOCA|nr:hypothetical protein GCM10011591_05260 [Nocardia camponoti]